MGRLVYSTALVGGTVENIQTVQTMLEEAQASINAIIDEQIADGANIDYSKLNLGNRIAASDIKAAAGIQQSKLAPLVIGNSQISDGALALEKIENGTIKTGTNSSTVDVTIDFSNIASITGLEKGVYLVLAMVDFYATGFVYTDGQDYIRFDHRLVNLFASDGTRKSRMQLQNGGPDRLSVMNGAIFTNPIDGGVFTVQARADVNEAGVTFNTFCGAGDCDLYAFRLRGIS